MDSLVWKVIARALSGGDSQYFPVLLQAIEYRLESYEPQESRGQSEP